VPAWQIGDGKQPGSNAAGIPIRVAKHRQRLTGEWQRGSGLYLALMRISRNWHSVQSMLAIGHRKRGKRCQLKLMADFPTDPQQAPPLSESLYRRV
jgi:hypothetical protein